jgi:hypothetical protein
MDVTIIVLSHKDGAVEYTLLDYNDVSYFKIQDSGVLEIGNEKTNDIYFYAAGAWVQAHVHGGVKE